MPPDLSKIPLDPLVSCLCVTENRQAFMPWVLWNFDRQTWRKRELIIVDSSDPPIQLPARRDVRVLRVPTGTWLGKKRNVALEAARGQVVAWFDDDDWQHPRRLSYLVPLLRKSASEFGASFIGPSSSFFFDLHSGRYQRYDVKDYAIFNGSVYYTGMVQHARFREDVLRNEDTLWISRLLRSRRGAALEGEHPTLFLWLTHDANISNQRGVRRCSSEGDAVLRAIGEAWKDTPKELAALRGRLKLAPAERPLRALREAAVQRALESMNRLRAASQAHPYAAPSSPKPASLPPAAVAPAAVVPAAVAPAAVVPAAVVPAAVVSGRSGAIATRQGPKLALFAVSDNVPAAPLQAGFHAHRLRARFGVPDALVALTVQRRQEWVSADYVGWFESRFLLEAGVAYAALSAEIERNQRACDVYAHSSERCSLRALAGRISANAESAFTQLLVQRLRKPQALLNREIPIAPWGFVSRPEILTRYVRDWLIPARSYLNDGNEPRLQAWLGTGKPRDLATTRLLSLLPSAFFHVERCSFHALELTRKPGRG
jgi:hypothetical protein